MLLASFLSLVVARCSRQSGMTFGRQAQVARHPFATCGAVHTARSGMAPATSSSAALEAMSETGQGAFASRRSGLFLGAPASNTRACTSSRCANPCVACRCAHRVPNPCHMTIHLPIASLRAALEVRLAMGAFLHAWPRRLLDVSSCGLPWRFGGGGEWGPKGGV